MQSHTPESVLKLSVSDDFVRTLSRRLPADPPKDILLLLHLFLPSLPFPLLPLICISLPLNHTDRSVMSGCRNLLCDLCLPVRRWVCTCVHMFRACLRVTTRMPTVHTGCRLRVCVCVRAIKERRGIAFVEHLFPHLSPS